MSSKFIPLPADRPIPFACEFTFKGQPCGKPVAFKWTPRTHPQNFAWVCRPCGEGVTGRNIDELTPVPQRTEGPKPLHSLWRQRLGANDEHATTSPAILRISFPMTLSKILAKAAKQNPFNANLGGDALREIRTILMREKHELERITALCAYAPATATGRDNIAKVQRLIDYIDAILGEPI